MATQKSTQAATDLAVESMLSEINSAAYFTESLFQKVGAPAESQEDEVQTLRDIIARMGWMADLALNRLGSPNCMYEGRAEEWLLSPRSKKMIEEGAQS